MGEWGVKDGSSDERSRDMAGHRYRLNWGFLVKVVPHISIMEDRSHRS